MQRLALTLLILLSPVSAVAEELPDDCSFDQAHLVAQLQALAVRIPGGRIDVDNRQVQWHLPAGELVSAGQGGCYDLGTSVSLKFADGRRPPNEVALKRLLDTVSTYWSAREARQIEAELTRHALKPRLLGNGDLELQAPASEAFFQGFLILLSGDEISVSWISA